MRIEKLMHEARDTPVKPAQLPRARGGMTRLAYLRAKTAGINLEPLLRHAKLTVDVLENPTATVSAQSQIDFLNSVAATLADEYLGFHLARIPDLREVGLLYYVMASSNTIFESLNRASRYSSFNHEGIVQNCIGNRSVGISLRYEGMSRHRDRHQIEFWVTVFLRICRQLIGRELKPERVRFVHVRKKVSKEFLSFFGPVEFGSAKDEIIFPAELKHAPVVTADPHLSSILISYCEEALAKERNKRVDSFITQVENTIAPLLPHRSANLREIARRLGISERTFSRRLAAEGLTYSTILENLRSHLATRYFSDGDLSISEVAWLLGYSEVSAFSHAFRRWTGRTPRAFIARN